MLLFFRVVRDYLKILTLIISGNIRLLSGFLHTNVIQFVLFLIIISSVNVVVVSDWVLNVSSTQRVDVGRAERLTPVLPLLRVCQCDQLVFCVFVSGAGRTATPGETPGLNGAGTSATGRSVLD